MCEGYVKLYRSISNWQWKTKPEMVALWVEILSQANFTDRDYCGEAFERGSFPTSIDRLSASTGLSPRQIRTCLARLKQTGEIEVKATSQGTKISVLNYARYQGEDEDSDKRPTNERQATDKRATTLKNVKNVKNVKKDTKVSQENKYGWGEYGNVLLYDREKLKLEDEFGREMTKAAIDFLDAYIEEKGYKSKSHSLAIRRWVMDAVRREPKRPAETTETYEMDLSAYD